MFTNISEEKVRHKKWLGFLFCLLNNGTAGTNAPTSGTYDSNVTISNPTKSITASIICTIDGNANYYWTIL